jgi:hypothetical protein
MGIRRFLKRAAKATVKINKGVFGGGYIRDAAKAGVSLVKANPQLAAMGASFIPGVGPLAAAGIGVYASKQDAKGAKRELDAQRAYLAEQERLASMASSGGSAEPVVQGEDPFALPSGFPPGALLAAAGVAAFLILRKK